MASKDLRVNVIFDAKTKQLDKAFKQINKMQSKLNQQATTQNKITSAVNKTNRAYKKSGSVIDGLTTKVHRLANAYLGVLGAKAALTASDTITRAENKLNNLNGGNTTATQKQLDQMYTSAQKVRMGYGDMMDNVSKSMMLAGDSFGGNINNAIRFQEVMAEAYSIGGASAAEMSSSMYQMIQALGSGILQGDELRSVREGAPLAYKEIEKLAQEIYGADENLKDLASQGKITSDIVVRAMLQAGDRMDEAFAKTDMTFAQAWTNIKNTALKSFEPVLQKMNDLLNSDVGRAIIDGIGTAIQFVAGTLMFVFGLIEKTATFIQTYGDTIARVLTTIAVVVLAVLIPTLLTKLWILAQEVILWVMIKFEAVKSALAAATAWAIANWQMALMILVIAAIIIALVWLSDGFTDACGNIVGAVFWLGATVWNIFVGLINGLIQYGWAYFVEPWISIIEFVLNVFKGGFDSFGDGVKSLLGNIISWFLSLGKVVTKIIDAIFGSDWTGQLNSLQDSVLKWGKNEKAITLAREAPELLQRTSAKDAFTAGYNWGSEKGQWISDKVSGLGDKISGALGVGSLPTNGISPELDAIKGDTAKIADSVELTEEDLAYLKDLAHMEWKKEFTTATIKVDMTNNNNVDKDFDLNSLAIGLRNLVEEEMFAVANGVYA